MRRNLSNIILHSIYFSFYGLVKYFPRPIGDLLRYAFTKPFIGSMGKVRISEGATLYHPQRIFLGNNVTINEWCVIGGFGGVEIQNDVRIGHRVTISSTDHSFSDPNVPIWWQDNVPGKVTIESDVWIGAGAIIVKGVRVGRGSVIGAGAVVTRDVKEFSIVGGVPARVIGVRRQE